MSANKLPRWSGPELIGHRIKARREELRMTARELGQRMGEMVAKGGKPWPPQTVYMMESGERAMVVNEVIAAAHLLGIPVMELFRPPIAEIDHVAGVEVGGVPIESDTLATSNIDIDAGTMQAAHAIRAIDRVRAEMFTLTQQQYVLIDDAKNALLGRPLAKLPEGEKAHVVATRIMMDDARSWYEKNFTELQELLDTQAEYRGGDDNGE